MAEQAPVAVDLSKYIETRLFEARPHIRGRRVPVATIVAFARANKWDVPELTYQFSLNEAQVLAALLYYEQHKNEIDSQEEVENAKFEDMKRLYGDK